MLQADVEPLQVRIGQSGCAINMTIEPLIEAGPIVRPLARGLNPAFVLQALDVTDQEWVNSDSSPGRHRCASSTELRR